MLTPINLRNPNDPSKPLHLMLVFDSPKLILGEDKLKRLQPYILNLLDRSSEPKLRALDKERFKILTLSKQQAAFMIDSAEKEESSCLLSSIQALCDKHLTDRVTVPQRIKDSEMDMHIWHRVMQFEVEDNQMVVKYLALGEFNNFDAAMLELDKIYPEVSSRGQASLV